MTLETGNMRKLYDKIPSLFGYIVWNRQYTQYIIDYIQSLSQFKFNLLLNKLYNKTTKQQINILEDIIYA